MKLKDALKFMFVLFCVITTFETLLIAVLGAVDSMGFSFEARELYKPALVALAGVLPVLILVRRENAPRKEWMLRKALHFLLTAGAVFWLLIYFGWLEANNALIIMIFFLVIYISAYTVSGVRAKRLAERLNERINAFRDSENATRGDRP